MGGVSLEIHGWVVGLGACHRHQSKGTSMTHIDAMKQVVVYFEHMVRTLQLRDESEPAQLLFKLRQAIKDAEGKENALRALHAENERLGLYKDAYAEQEPVAKNDGGKITWLIDDWPQNCLLYTYPPKSFSYEQVKAHIRAASMSANDIVVGSDVTNDGVSIVIRRRDEILYAEFFAHPPQRTEQEPVAWIWKYANGEEEVVFVPPRHVDATHVDAPSTITSLYATPPQRTKVVFPTMLRKMWSGGEVQAWLDENVNKENT